MAVGEKCAIVGIPPKTMIRDLFFLLLVLVSPSILSVVRGQLPSAEERISLLRALNGHRREVSATSSTAVWSERYADGSLERAQLCQFTPTDRRSRPDESEHVTTVQSDFLVDALNFWVEDGKRDARDGCPRYACNDYYTLISEHMFEIGCAYKQCPNLGGTYVVCRYDYILV